MIVQQSHVQAGRRKLHFKIRSYIHFTFYKEAMIRIIQVNANKPCCFDSATSVLR
jgi:hypothetical protein